MKYAYINKNFSHDSLATIEDANRIIAKYYDRGLRLTVRQLYYQLVAADLIPNNLRSYKRLAGLVNDGRWAGLIDWSAIEDRLRNTVRKSTWGSPKAIMNSVLRSYQEDLWDNQPWHVEVMCEKDAVSNIVEPVCLRMGVRFTANRGYASASLIYEVAGRLDRMADDGKQIALIYLGDHDPSGLDMDRDIVERLELLSEGQFDFELERLALTMDQVETWQPPENPAKTTDSRYQAYMLDFGTSSWELDAAIDHLEDLLERQIGQFVDWDTWDERTAKQNANLDKLREFAAKL